MTISASHYVTLEIVGGMNGGYGPSKFDFVRTLSDGSTQSGSGGLGWRVPAGQVLVVTDVDWQYVHPQGAAGVDKIEVLRLFIENIANPMSSRRVFESTVTLSSKGEGGTHEAMATGFAVSSKGRIGVDIMPGPIGPPSGLQHLLLHGYLIADV